MYIYIYISRTVGRTADGGRSDGKSTADGGRTAGGRRMRAPLLVGFVFHYLWHELLDKPDLDTCLTSEAKNSTDLNCNLQSSAWDGSGPQMETSRPNPIIS